MEYIKTEQQSGVGTIIFNRPAQNAMRLTQKCTKNSAPPWQSFRKM